MKRFGKNYQSLNQYPYPYNVNPPKKMNIILDEDPFVQSYDSILVQKLKQSNQENFNDNCRSKKFLRLSELAEANLYNTLDIRENCTTEEVKRAYKKMAVKYHPDKGGDPYMFNKVQEAYKILSYPLTKKIYDTFGTRSLKLVKEIVLKNQMNKIDDEVLQTTIQQGDLDVLECLFQINE